MTALIVELPPKLYAQLRAEGERQGKPPEGIAREWLAERLAAPGTTISGAKVAQPTERERVRAALRAAEPLVEPTAQQLAWTEANDVTLDEVRDALDRTDGKPLSEIILEQRGPKG